MNPAYFHLLAGHTSVLIACGAVLALIGELRRDASLLTTSMVLLAISALLVGLLYLSGDGAREVVIQNTSVPDEVIHRHEESAEPTVAAGMVMGVAALAALLVRKRPGGLPRDLRIATAVLALVTLGLMIRTAHDGGRIRHPEVVGPASSLVPAAAAVDARS